MLPNSAANHLEVFVYSSVFSHCFTDTVCRTHHFLQPLPQMQGQGAKASQISLSGSPLFSVLVMDFLVYLLSMLCLLSQCTGRTHTHTHTHIKILSMTLMWKMFDFQLKRGFQCLCLMQQRDATVDMLKLYRI